LNFVSDEFNGVTGDNRGVVRPRFEHRELTLAKATKDNSENRIFLRVHWRDDADSGKTVGNQVADVCIKAYKNPVPKASGSTHEASPPKSK
jgi:hypothetical protein